MIKVYTLSLFMLIFLLSFDLIESSLKFNIPSFRDKCFNKELFIETNLLIRYDLTGFEKDFNSNEQIELFKNIKIFVKNEKGINIYETELKNRKGKLPVHITEYGNYLICTRYYKPRRGKDLPNSVVMGLKLGTDFQYTNIEQSLHKEDINNFWRKIRDIKKDIRPSIESSKQELKEEDKTAKSIISSVNTYYKLCCIQLVIIIVVTIYTIFMYQDFFKQKSII